MVTAGKGKDGGPKQQKKPGKGALSPARSPPKVRWKYTTMTLPEIQTLANGIDSDDERSHTESETNEEEIRKPQVLRKSLRLRA